MPRCLFFFDLLGCLPEKEIRTDCGPKNRDQGFPSLLAMWQGRNECIVKSCAPVGMNNKCADNIRKENERQPLERAGNLVVAQPDSRPRDTDGKNDHPEMRTQVTEHLCGVRHSGEISANIDGVRHEKRCDREGNNGPRKFGFEGGCETAPADHADTGAHHLYGSHERPGNQCRPKQVGAELRAGYGVVCDSGWIIACRTGNQTWPQRIPEAASGPKGRPFNILYHSISFSLWHKETVAQITITERAWGVCS